MSDGELEIPTEWLRGLVYSPKEVAEIFNVDPQTVTKWAKSGTLGFFRSPGHTRCYPEAEVTRLAAGRPASAIVKKLAEQDNARYRAMWESGWRNAEMGRKRKKAAGEGAGEDAA